MSSQSSGKTRVLIIVLVTALLVGYIVFQRVSNSGSSGGTNIIVPWGLIAIVISFYFFGETNRVRKAKRDERREHIEERRQEILDNLRKKKGKDTNEGL